MNGLRHCRFLLLGLALTAFGAAAQDKNVELVWLGQSAFRITTPGGKVVLTDPWLLKNPLTPEKYKDFDALGVLPLAQLPRFNKSGRVSPAPGKEETHPGGDPVGFIIELENGFRIWHMGDSGVFGDMKWIGEYYKPDLVLIPIGGHFTMDPADAAEFLKAMDGFATKVIVPKPGEAVRF